MNFQNVLDRYELTDASPEETVTFMRNQFGMVAAFIKENGANHTHAYSGSTGECVMCNASVIIAR